MINFDTDIIEQCKKGERRAQMQLYATFYKRVYNTCYRILRNSSEAEDTMQDSFLKVFSGLANYNSSVPFEAWVVRIAITASIDKLRKKDIEVVNLNQNINYEVIDWDDSEDWEMVTNKVEAVKKAMEKLPESSRLVLNLYLMEGYDHEEIAEILNIAPGTVRIQYMRAKQRLIELM